MVAWRRGETPGLLPYLACPALPAHEKTVVICLNELLDGFPVVAPQQLPGLPEEETTAT